MKLIALRNNYPQTALEDKSIVINTLPDTAFLKDGKPFFIPEFATDCRIEAHLAVRISRLGRSISERFAHRYYDAITVGATFIAENLREDLANKGLSWELATGFDNAAPVGKFIPLYSQQNVAEDFHTYHPLSKEIHFKLNKNGKTLFEDISGNMIHHVDEIISYISQWYTLRQGDIFYLGCPSQSEAVAINDHIEGFINDDCVLKFNIK